MSFFWRDQTPNPAPAFEVKKRCGMLVRCSESGYVWIVAPFWDLNHRTPVSSPDVKVEAIIVLNQIVEGCLPLSSFFAADSRLAMDNIYVLNDQQAHDWHPGYNYEQAVNALTQVKQLPSVLGIGDVTVYYLEGENFVTLLRRDPQNDRVVMIVTGTGLYFPPDHIMVATKVSTIDSLCIAGSYEPELFRSTVTGLMEHSPVGTGDALHLFFMHDWIQANPHAYIDAYNHLGFTVYGVGEAE